MLTPNDKEDLRRAALEFLAARHPTAHALPAVRRTVARETGFPFEDSDLESALDFWKGQGHVTFTYDTAGATRYWVATAAGLLLIERGQ